MPNIQILDNNIINQIAAGEVVERPASVVKELVENAIDAGATAITVEIRDGGTSLIRVTDNGCGIPADEVRTAFLRHATSKIRDMDDLENVLTLGFRGEALSSIAGVAQVEVLTKTADVKEGMRLEIHGGEVIAEEAAGGTTGTVFTVRNLFYNVPARRKFLKKPAAEGGQVSEVVVRAALGHPEVAVKYIVNAVTTIQTTGANDLNTTMFQVHGQEFASKMIAAENKRDGFRISGFVGRPESARGNRSMQYFFINGRYIKSDVVQSAIEDAYRTRLPHGRFPAFILRLEMPPMQVDVNVHPTKLEVRFSDERRIYDLVFDAANKALKGETLIPQAVIGKPMAEAPMPPVVETEVAMPAMQPIAQPTAQPPIPPTPRPAAPKAEKKDSAPQSGSGAIFFNEPFTQTALQEAEAKLQQEAVPAAEEKPKYKPFFHNYRIVGQIFFTYWILEQDGTAYLIDQHAAHERVLFEAYLEKLRKGDAIPQSLLMPVAVKLSPTEREVVRENGEFLQKLGFEIEELNDQAVAIRALPYVFENPAETGFFMEIVDALSDGAGVSGDLYDARLTKVATMACKAAVKANDRLSEMEARALMERLLTLENPFTCPHGRPTIVELTKREMEKMFKRIQ